MGSLHTARRYRRQSRMSNGRDSPQSPGRLAGGRVSKPCHNRACSRVFGLMCAGLSAAPHAARIAKYGRPWSERSVRSAIGSGCCSGPGLPTDDKSDGRGNNSIKRERLRGDRLYAAFRVDRSFVGGGGESIQWLTTIFKHIQRSAMAYRVAKTMVSAARISIAARVIAPNQVSDGTPQPVSSGRF